MFPMLFAFFNAPSEFSRNFGFLGLLSDVFCCFVFFYDKYFSGIPPNLFNVKRAMTAVECLKYEHRNPVMILEYMNSANCALYNDPILLAEPQYSQKSPTV
jgi:hypothetical protein